MSINLLNFFFLVEVSRLVDISFWGLTYVLELFDKFFFLRNYKSRLLKIDIQ